jgi:cytochrome c biogenesis protein CcdA
VLVPAALSDSINPCAFAVIILLLTSILTRYKRKRKVLLAGSLFTLAIFFSYLFM